jgi:hydrogenase small subunit
MIITRRDFLRRATASAVGAGLDPFDLTGLNTALANPAAPSVLWIQGSSCTGCTMSFLNYISPTAPQTAADVLISSINLAYHPNLAAAAGDSVLGVVTQIYNAGNYILAVEGGIPTAFGGYACVPWGANGVEATFQKAVTDLAARAARILCIGTCSAFGGIPAAPPNPTGVVSVGRLTGKPTINIAGRPPHPDWIVGTIVQLLLGHVVPLDASSRPTSIYGRNIHDNCPREERNLANGFGAPDLCLRGLGCRGPITNANCYSLKWNNGVNWCIGANAPCNGCVNADFSSASSFLTVYSD